MEIRFECPQCQSQMAAKSDYAGKEGKCKCGTAVVVPGNVEKMKFACQQCGKGISVSNRYAGRQGKCPLCKGVIQVPVLGLPVPSNPSPAPLKVAAGSIRFACMMCKAAIETPKNAAGRIIECPTCGCFTKVPGGQANRAGSPWSRTEQQAADKPVGISGKVQCPSCEKKLRDDAAICTFCGIYVKSGRPILTSRDIDVTDMECKTEDVVRGISWLIPFGIYPVCSEAIGNHRPYVTWGVALITVIVSIWFLVLEFSGSATMMTAKNLMLWSSQTQPPDARRIELFYTYTSYGDAAAFAAKKETLAGTVPDNELDIAALNALAPEERCFGQYRFSQLITHAFLHGGILHLAGNMLFLLVLGSRVNAAIGNVQMLMLYPVLAVAAAMTHLIAIGSQPPTPMLGASGAVMGLAGAYLLLFPLHKIYMTIWLRWGLMLCFRLSFTCFAVRGFWVVLFYILFDIIAVSLTLTTGTAHWAHLGGFIWGFVIAFGLLAGRLVYSGGDAVSLILGKYAWPLIGTPQTRLK